MPLNKKIIFIPIFLLFSTSIFSGCILQDLLFGVSFDITDYDIKDSEGFPALNLFFSASGKVILKMYNENSELMDTDYFYSDSNTTLNIGSYMENIESGTYHLKVYNSDNNEVRDEEFKLNGPSITISSCDQKWWKKDGSYFLVGLKFSLKNTGDSPAYPYKVKLSTGSEMVAGYITPKKIFPGSSEEVYCYLFHEGVFSEENYEVEILDKNNKSMASGSFSFNVRKNVYDRNYYISTFDNALVVLPYIDFLHDYYSNLERIYADDYSLFVFDRYDESFVDLLVNLIISSLDYSKLKFNTMPDKEKVEYVASFVQDLDYIKDSAENESYEYPNYPLETVFNGKGGGDCEDKAILTSNLLYSLGFETALLRLPDHMAVGVKLGENAVRGDYYAEDYDFLETTSPGYKCGQVSDEKYESPSSLTIYPVEDRPFIIHEWKNGVIFTYKNTPEGDIVKVVLYIENLGIDTAENVVVEGLFFTDTGLEFNNNQVTVGTMNPGDKQKIVMTVEIPDKYVTKFETRAYLNGEVIDSEKSKDYFV